MSQMYHKNFLAGICCDFFFNWHTERKTCKKFVFFINCSKLRIIRGQNSWKQITEISFLKYISYCPYIDKIIFVSCFLHRSDPNFYAYTISNYLQHSKKYLPTIFDHVKSMSGPHSTYFHNEVKIVFVSLRLSCNKYLSQ